MDQSKSKAWHDERRSGIGGSDVAAALGVSPWKTQLELWGDKTGLVEDLFEGNEATYWGTVVEKLLADRFVQDHPDRSLVFPDSMCHEEHACLRANIDGLICELSPNNAAIGIWEAKTSARDFKEVPVHYQLQVQHYMHIYNLKFAIISVLFGGNRYEEFIIERDPTYASDLVPQLLKFWTAVTTKMPVFKPTNMADIRILQEIDGTPTGSLEVGDDNPWALTIEKIRNHAAEEKRHKGAGALLKTEITKLMQGQKLKTLKINGKAAATIVSVKDSSAFDMVRFKAEQKGLFDSFSTKIRRGYVSLRVNK